jgi:hypothetical protein
VGDANTSKRSRIIGFVVGLAALAAVPALGLGAFAAADTSSGTGSADSESPAMPVSTGRRPMLSDAQKQCLSDQGVTLPQPSSSGERPQVSQEQRDAFRAAAQACGIEFGGHRAPLTDAQRQCLSDQGVTLPQPSSSGERPQVSQEQRDAFRGRRRRVGSSSVGIARR